MRTLITDAQWLHNKTFLSIKVYSMIANPIIFSAGYPTVLLLTAILLKGDVSSWHLFKFYDILPILI